MLSAEFISRSFRRVRALDGVSLQVEPGARIGLAGPSGSGKSTLARTLAVLEPPDAGVVTVDGRRVDAWGVRAPRELRHRVQLVFQAPRLSVDPRLRVGAAILEPLGRVTGREVLLAEWAERVGLTPDLLERFPHEVSEGQLQRACLARALIVRPRYLLCDELSSMLDVSTQAALLETIAAAQMELGLGVLLITHDRILADTWCDTVVDIRELTRAGGSLISR
jgi:peptide/nickel transport system ATP-binding protein